MKKSRAFLLHLLVSLLVAGGLLALFVTFWYPMPYFLADGGWQGLRLIVGVDLVLGPLLTLVVYKTWKSRRHLLTDYSVIAVIQVAALVFGIGTVRRERTVLVIFADKAFYTVNAEDAASLGAQASLIAAANRGAPAYAFIALPQELHARQAVLLEAFRMHRPLYALPWLLRPFDEEALLSASRPWLGVKPGDAARALPRERVRRFVAEHGGAEGDYEFFLVNAKYRNLVAAFRRVPVVSSSAHAARQSEAEAKACLHPVGYLWAPEPAQKQASKPS